MPAEFRNLFGTDRDSRWIPAADATNAPPGTLLRADNITFDEIGTPTVRRGTTVVLPDPINQVKVTTLNELMVRSIAVVELRPAGVPTVMRFTGTDGYVQRDGAPLVDIPHGSGDIQFGNDLNYLYFARGDKSLKTDGIDLFNWGLAKPTAAPTATASALNIVTIATCNSGESPGFVVNEGVQAQDTGFDGTANGAVKLTPIASSGRASTTKTFASDQDLLTFSGTLGGDDDLFDILVYLSEPEKTDTITVMIGMGTGGDAFQTDYYYFDFKIKNPSVVDLKTSSQSKVTSAVSLSAANLQIADPSAARTHPKGAEATYNIIKSNQDRQTRRRERKDAQAASPAWTHFSVPRGQFNRVGGTSGRDWRTIRAIKVVYQAIPGSTGEMRIDNPTITIGGARSYTGKFRFAYQWVRNVEGMIDKGPLSDISAELTVQQSAITITIPGPAITARDPQATETWIFIYGGQLDTWYRCAVTGVKPGGGGIRLDEFGPGAGDGAVDINDRSRYITHDFGWSPSGLGSAVIQVSLLRSEADLLNENEKLEIGIVPCPINIIGIEGPTEDRMVAVTQEGFVYWSGQRAHSTFNIFHAGLVDPDPLWVRRTSSGTYIGTKRDIHLISGSGNVDIDGFIDFVYQRLNTPHPPVDQCAWVDGNRIIFRSADGLMTLSGGTISSFSGPLFSSAAFSGTDIEPLWRGKARHGVDALNTATGRFRMVVDNQVMTVIAPEGTTTEGSNVLHRYDMIRQRWMRHVYPFGIMSLYREMTGGVLAGTNDGRVFLIDTGNQDSGANIPIEIWTRFDDGADPLSGKYALNFSSRIDTGGNNLDVSIHTDGNNNRANRFPVNTPQQADYHTDLSWSGGESLDSIPVDVSPSDPAVYPIGEFRSVQLRMTGSFYRFYLYLYNIFCRIKPQELHAFDTGYISAPKGQDLLDVREVEATVRSGISSVRLTCFYDGVSVYVTKAPITKIGEVQVVRFPIPRYVRGLQGRFLLQAYVDNTGQIGVISDASGYGNRGLECYRIRLQVMGAGNKTGYGMQQIYPAGAK